MSATVIDFPEPAVRARNGVAGFAKQTAAQDRELTAANARVAALEAKLERVDEDLTEVLNALVANGALSVEALRS